MIHDVLMRVGSWDIKLENLPEDIKKALEFFGHVAFIDGDVDQSLLSDSVLPAARYVGVLRKIENQNESTYLEGPGLAFWLGDEDNKGLIYDEKEFTGETYANTIRDLLPATVTEGTISSVAGTYSGLHRFQTPRQAIQYVSNIFNAEWRVNTDFSFDAGPASALFQTDQGIIVRRSEGPDLYIKSYDEIIETKQDAEDYTTKVVLLAEGEGSEIETAEAELDPSEILYKDFFGNKVNITRLISESETLGDNAPTRAQSALNNLKTLRSALNMSTTEYDLEGTFRPGDTIFVYDPESGLVGNQQVPFRGNLLPATRLRVIGVNFPVIAGTTIGYRDNDGNWYDLTPYVRFEKGDVVVNVGAIPRSLIPVDTSVIDRINAPDPEVDDGIAPGKITTNTPFDSYTYLNGEGNSVAAIIAGWQKPLNGDGSTLVDGQYYEIQYKITGDDEFASQFVTLDETQTNVFSTLYGLANGASYTIRIRAVDIFGNLGEFSDDVVMFAQEDDIPPSDPAPASVVAGNPLRIQVTHQLGKSTGGTYNLERDLSHLDVHVGTTEAFVVSNATKVGALEATASNLTLEIPAVGTFDAPGDTQRWVRVVAVDKSGNASNPSTSVSVTATLVDTVHINNAAITEAKIGNLAVTTAKIANLAVDNGKIANLDAIKINAGFLSVDRIEANTITGAKLVNGTITATQIANSTITATQIEDSTITGAKIAGGTITATQILDGTITGAKIADTTITGSKIVGGTITATQINNGTITGAKIANGTITGAKIDDGTITGAKISGGTITNVLIADSTILGGKIANATISGTKIASTTIAAGNLASNSVTTVKINALAVTNAKIDTINAEKITAGTMSADRISGGTIIGANLQNFSGMTIQTGTTMTISAVTMNLTASSNLRFVSSQSSTGGLGYQALQIRASNASGNELWKVYRITSSERFKQDIQDAPKYDIDLLRPVLYRSRLENDDQTRFRIGLIAEEAINLDVPGFVSTDDDGQPESIDYDMVGVILINEIKDLRKRVQELENK